MSLDVYTHDKSCCTFLHR